MKSETGRGGSAVWDVLDERTRALRVGPELAALRYAVARELGDSLAGILFYGSCLRSGNLREGLVDLYVLVDDYSSAYGHRPLAVWNYLLPPNVFFLEVEVPGGVVRSKYAVLSMADLLAGTTRRWFHPYLWGRFSQPVARLYARDSIIEARIRQALAQAACTLLEAGLPMMPPQFTGRALWERSLDLSYATEMRPEKSDRITHLYDTYAGYYEALTEPLLGRLAVTREPVNGEEMLMADISPAVRRAAALGWWLRKLQGRTLHVLRLIKGLFTFRGGVDYALWKLERHTGVRVEEDDPVRRYPLIYGWGLIWRLRRRGVLR